MCDDPEKAQDLVQETFIRALEGWDGFDGRSEPSTWLYTIASRACQRMERRRAGEPRSMQSLELLLPSGDETLVDVPTDGETPLDWVERRDVVQAVQRAIEALPLAFRLPVVLKEMEGLSVEEVASVLGVKPATVKTRLHRARLLLRKELSQALPTKPSGHDHADAPDSSCLDLLWAKQEALDRGVDFPIPAAHLCERCRSVFATLDLASDVCHAMQRRRAPDEVRQAIEARVMGERG
jgi:RNA polymerase sigma-70 factor, ECF subfamily